MDHNSARERHDHDDFPLAPDGRRIHHRSGASVWKPGPDAGTGQQCVVGGVLPLAGAALAGLNPLAQAKVKNP